MEPPHLYVHETSSSTMHHRDYLNGRNDQALCGVTFQKPGQLDPTIRPGAVCPDCDAKLAEYHLNWWREKAETATAELDALRVKYRELAEYVDNQGRQVAGLEQPAPVSGERREIDRELQAGSTGEPSETTPTPVLDQVRNELIELCRGFDESVPFFRVKNSVDAFNEKLKSDERILLAHEIGADGSLIRWCTKEIESLGWQITNNRVHGDADDMMDAWKHDLYQRPKKTKRRLGRSR